jgi:hypothetical protein
MAKQPSWGSPRSRRDSTNDPEKYAKSDVQITAGDLDLGREDEVIERQSGDYKPKYEAEGHEPRNG